MNKFKYKKVYVLAPYNCATGGIELCHQLVDFLISKGMESYIVYVNSNHISKDQTVTSTYGCYDIRTTSYIEDSDVNILVLPEIYFEFVLKFKNIKIACWWMSVDNRYNYTNLIQKIYFYKSLIPIAKYIYHLIKRDTYHYKNTNHLLRKESKRIIHMYQSHYAQFHLYKNDFSPIYALSDYINSDYNRSEICNKKRVILYNPKKGIEYTRKIIRLLPKEKFIPLIGLTRSEMKNLLSTSMLYIDFGNFPGKDRIPREAVMSGCCLITGKNGASYFYEDVPIDERYKFKTNNKNLNRIVDSIEYVLNNYRRCVDDFDSYRKIIESEKEQFYNEIEYIFL